jgi:pimeloyl-ACP methyl ester carboxylesterase
MNTGLKDGKPVYDFTDQLAAFTKPVLFVAGADSEVVGPALQERQRQYYPASELVTIAGAGHDVSWTRTAETMAAIRTYLAEVQ